MAEPIKLLDVVALTTDLPEAGLWRGQVGTVVEMLAGGQAYEVEFCDRDGRTYESLGLRPVEIGASAGVFILALFQYGAFVLTFLQAVAKKYFERHSTLGRLTHPMLHSSNDSGALYAVVRDVLL